MKKKSWTPLSVLGMLVMVLFAIICIAPFIYMMIMSFTQSTTLMLHFDELFLCIWQEWIFKGADQQFDRSNQLLSVQLYYFLHGCLWVREEEFPREREDFQGLSCHADDSRTGYDDSCIHYHEENGRAEYIFLTGGPDSERIRCVPDPPVHVQCAGRAVRGGEGRRMPGVQDIYPDRNPVD